MARGELAISHDTFRELPADRSHNYLRDLLAGAGVLPAYHAPIEQMERWLDATLAPLDDEDKGLVGRFARWHLLRRLRSAAEHDELSKSAIYSARGNINGAVRLGQWAAKHGTTITVLSQPQLESYLADYPGARNSQQTFVAWLGRTRVNTNVTIPWRGTTMPEVTVPDADRWDQINTLLFAQPLETVIAMRTDQITLEPDGRVLVAFHALPIEMPPGLDDLVRRHLTRPGSPSIASTDHGWLFPGRHPGRHLVRETFRGHLVAVGVRPGRSRHAAMFALASQVPAPVLAELIGIADKTATKWAALATRDWSEYVTQRDTHEENG